MGRLLLLGLLLPLVVSCVSQTPAVITVVITPAPTKDHITVVVTSTPMPGERSDLDQWTPGPTDALSPANVLWKEHTSSQLGFSMRYPETCTVDATEAGWQFIEPGRWAAFVGVYEKNDGADFWHAPIEAASLFFADAYLEALNLSLGDYTMVFADHVGGFGAPALLQELGRFRAQQPAVRHDHFG